MNRLLEYLDSHGWLETPGTRAAAKGAWIYQWMADPSTGVPAGKVFLFRRRCEREDNTEMEIELFIINDEDRSLEIAKELNDGKHPDSPHSDPKTGKKIGYL